MTTAQEIDLQAGQALLERFEAGEIFIPMPSLTWLEMQGKDAGQVLGNLTTNQVKTLAVGTGVETFITEGRGRTFGHGIIYALEGRLRLLSVPGQFDRLVPHIDRYVIREDVRFLDLTDSLATLFWPGIAGSRLGIRWGLVPAQAPLLCCKSVMLEGISVTCFQVPWTRPGDWLLVVPREQAETLEGVLVAMDLLPGPQRLLHSGRIAHRYPWFGIDFDEQNLPQELARDASAISFTKGCYLGQETVARLDALGQVQKKLKLWKFSGTRIPPQGTELRSQGKTVATVTSSAFHDSLGCSIALAMTRRSHFQEGSTAESDYGMGTVIGD